MPFRNDRDDTICGTRTTGNARRLWPMFTAWLRTIAGRCVLIDRAGKWEISPQSHPPILILPPGTTHPAHTHTMERRFSNRLLITIIFNAHTRIIRTKRTVAGGGGAVPRTPPGTWGCADDDLHDCLIVQRPRDVR